MTTEELRDFNKKTKKIMRDVEYHAAQAENFKKLYELTKNRKGIYKLLNILAKNRNRYHCEKGMELGISRMKSTNKVFKEFDVTKENMKNFTEELIDDAYASIMKES